MLPIGCKYISLLEGFTSLPDDPQDRENFIRDLLSQTSDESQIESIIKDTNILVEELKRKILEDRKLICTYVGRKIKINSIFIKGQVSILLAPDISDTASAIRPQFLANIIDNLGLGVKPTVEETKNFIKDSGLFNIMGIVSFKSDEIAKLTCDWFTTILNKPPTRFRKSLEDGHLKALGIQLSNNAINLFDKPLIESVQERNKGFERHVIQLLEELKKEST